MKFKYQAKTKDGETQVGFVEAGSRETAVQILTSHDLFVLTLESVGKSTWYDWVFGFLRRVKIEDFVVFTRQLSVLLGARLSLSNTLTALYEQTENPVLKEAVFQVSEDVDSGLAFSQALERQPGVFSPFFVSMVRSAEVTGNLDQAAEFLADYVEREAGLVARARSALIYPVIVIIMFIIVAGTMVGFVFPQVQPVFEQSGVALPFFTTALISLGEFLGAYWLGIFFFLIVLGIIVADYLRTPEGRGLKDDLRIRLPLVRRIYRPILMSRFANASAMLLRGGVPVAQAMEIVGETIDNVLYRDLLHEVSERVREGQTLSEALSRKPEFFPVLVPRMVAVGEATGKLDEIFNRIATFYSRESDAIVSNLVDLIQPALIIGIGLLVGLLFASILLPLYKLTLTIQ